MNSLSSSKNSAPLLLAALVMALLFAVYYYVILPKNDELAAKESSVQSLQSEVGTLVEEIALAEQTATVNGTNEQLLRKKLPANRNLDELLLAVEEIELSTETRIQAINFNDYDSLVSNSSLQDPNQVDEATEGEQATDTTDSQSEQATEEVEQTPVSTIDATTLPPALKLVTFDIDVAAPNHIQLKSFIQEIELLERVMHIEAIDYDLAGEEQLLTAINADIVEATVQVTTFYYQ